MLAAILGLACESSMLKLLCVKSAIYWAEVTLFLKGIFVFNYRWNSAHDMLERFLEQQPAICAALLSNEVRKTEKDLCTLTEADITTSEEVLCALKPMKEATLYMSAEKTPTLSVIAPLQDRLTNGLAPNKDDSPIITEMKTAMSTDLEKRQANVNLYYTIHPKQVCIVLNTNREN